MKHIAPISIWNDLLLLMFILSGFAALCFAIININEKAKARYDAEFAGSIISTGRGHYEKMNEMHNTLGILRHDYKYHIKAIGDFVDSDDMGGIRKYLSEIQAQIPEEKLRQYCTNPVLNSLLGSYAERCEMLNIKFSVLLTMPDTISVPNYELCIIFGNLLENAVEACAKLKSGGKIELVARTQEDSLFTIMVKNKYNGELTLTEGNPVSTKKDGGFGLRSVRAVSDRYEGHMLTEWDGDVFAVYVMLNV
jgi:sensor histidine kinase regulating citrate/malate metabolism